MRSRSLIFLGRRGHPGVRLLVTLPHHSIHTYAVLSHEQLTKYFRAFASYHGMNSNDDNPRVSYNTRVELVEKQVDDKGKEAGWTLTLKELVKTGMRSVKAIWTRAVCNPAIKFPGADVSRFRGRTLMLLSLQRGDSMHPICLIFPACLNGGRFFLLIKLFTRASIDIQSPSPIELSLWLVQG